MFYSTFLFKLEMFIARAAGQQAFEPVHVRLTTNVDSILTLSNFPNANFIYRIKLFFLILFVCMYIYIYIFVIDLLKILLRRPVPLREATNFGLA